MRGGVFARGRDGFEGVMREVSRRKGMSLGGRKMLPG